MQGIYYGATEEDSSLYITVSISHSFFILRYCLLGTGKAAASDTRWHFIMLCYKFNRRCISINKFHFVTKIHAGVRHKCFYTNVTSIYTFYLIFLTTHTVNFIRCNYIILFRSSLKNLGAFFRSIFVYPLD